MVGAAGFDGSVVASEGAWLSRVPDHPDCGALDMPARWDFGAGTSSGSSVWCVGSMSGG